MAICLLGFILTSNTINYFVNLNIWELKVAITILMINSLTICISYDSIYFFDKSAYKRFAKVRNFKKINLTQFDFIVHKIPCLIISLLWCLLGNEKYYLGYYSGIPSLMINLFYGYFIVGQIDLSDVYVYLPRNNWIKLWMINIITHLSIGLLINNFQ